MTFLGGFADISPSPSVSDLRYCSLPSNLDEIPPISTNLEPNKEDKFETDHSQPIPNTFRYEPNVIVRTHSDTNLQYKEDYHLPPYVDNKTAWERGNPDFMGRNAFEKIKTKLNEAVGETPIINEAVAKIPEVDNRPEEQTTMSVANEDPPSNPEPKPQAQPEIPREYTGFDLILQKIEASLGEKIKHQAPTPFKPVLPTRISKRHLKSLDHQLAEDRLPTPSPPNEDVKVANGVKSSPKEDKMAPVSRRVLGRGRARKPE